MNNGVTVSDLHNIQQRFCHDMFPDVCDFVAHLERAGHRVRLKTDEERRITCVFFIHTHGKEELKRLCESVVVDATYSVNSHKFALLNFVVASAVSSEYKRNSLATIHVAGCWMHNGSGESYGWDLKQLRSTVWPTVTDTALLPYNFVTDKDRALMNATKNIFPESNQLLCYVHIMKNFIQRLIKNMTKEVKLGELPLGVRNVFKY